MALTSDETELFNLAMAAMPDWFTNEDRQREDVAAFAKLTGAARTQIKEWLLTQAAIKSATGASAGAPDWLDQHARDRGTRRRLGELDPALRDRLRRVEDALIRVFLLAAVQAMMTAEGVAGTPAMVEMPRDGAFIGSWGQNTGEGGTFVGPLTGSVMEFTPTVRFAYPPYHQSVVASGTPATIKVKSGRVRSHRIVITGSTSAGNNGTFVSVGLNGNAIRYVNAAGVAGADAVTDWALQRRDINSQVLEGTPMAFGYDPVTGGFADRILPGSRAPGILIILPLGASEAFALAVAEMIRQKKAAGVIATIERRLVP